MCQDGRTPLISAALMGHLPVIEYLLEKGANIEAKDRVSYHWYATAHASYMNIYLWICQHGSTPLICGASNNSLPVVEYLVEKGADVEAKGNVSDVISSIWNHYKYVTRKYISVNISGWIHSIEVECNQQSFTSGWIFGGERGWYRGKGSCKWEMCYH